jgi:DNA-directed RNA polymerase subunit RPC12/RpoP
MERFCSGCGAALSAGANYCATCGAVVVAPVPATPDGSLATCPGCGTTQGRPGAMCPYCSSKYPNDALIAAGIKVALGGGALYAFGALAKSDTISGCGVLVALIGAGMFASGLGREGAQQQQSCCGCTCLLMLLVLPAGALLLYAHGGPLMALAAVPLWIPTAHLLDGLVRLAIRGSAALRHSGVAQWLSNSLRTPRRPSRALAGRTERSDSP